MGPDASTSPFTEPPWTNRCCVICSGARDVTLFVVSHELTHPPTHQPGHLATHALIFFAANVEESQLTLLSTSQTPHCGTPTHGANPAWRWALSTSHGRSVAIRSLGASQIQQGNGHSLGRCTRQDSSPHPFATPVLPVCGAILVPLLIVPLRVEPGLHGKRSARVLGPTTSG